MSATSLPKHDRLQRDLEALYELVRAQGREIDALKQALANKHPNGNRQRRTPSGN
jgi:predicted component of type VI protein secretion system